MFEVGKPARVARPDSPASFRKGDVGEVVKVERVERPNPEPRPPTVRHFVTLRFPPTVIGGKRYDAMQSSYWDHELEEA